MRLGNTFKRVFGLSDATPVPQCRLSQDEALEIAGKAINNERELVVSRIIETPDGPEWLLITPVIGSHLAIRIRDKDGKVLAVERQGSR